MAFWNRNAREKDGLGTIAFTVRGLPVSIFSIILGLLVSFGGFLFGYDTGQISDMLIMKDFLRRFGDCGDNGVTCRFSNVRSGLIVGLLSIGNLFGALANAPIADRLGRKKAMTLECVALIVGIIIQVTSIDAWYQVAIGRLVAGLGVGGLSGCIPMYQSETAPPQIRGTLTGTYQLMITFGILIAYCICIGTRSIHNSAQWRVVVSLSILFSLFLGIAVQFMPESPRWDTRHGRTERARRTIAKIRALPVDHPIVDFELEEILDSIEVEEGIDKTRLAQGNIPTKEELVARREREPWLNAWLHLFTGFRRGSSRIGYRTLLGMSLQALQQLTGINYFLYYGATIFQSVGIHDSYVTQIILGAVNFFCTFFGLYVMERFRRRTPLILGGLWQSFWLFVYAISASVQDPTKDDGVGKLCIVTTCLFIAGFASTWAPGIWILTGETFPTYTRAKQGALATASNWFFNFLLAFFTPFIISAIGFKYGFVFAGCNLAAAIVVFFFLYESGGISVENVDLMYRDPACKPWTSGSWYPPGYNSRREVEAETRASKQGSVIAETHDDDKHSISECPSTNNHV